MSSKKITQKDVDGAKAIYPETVREAVQYLYGYMCQECNANRDRLAARLIQHGYQVSSDYFYKLFTGRWVEKGKFTASEKSILLMSGLLKKSEMGMLSNGRFPPVQTEVMELFRNVVDSIRKPSRICKWAFFSGPSGAQKSYSAKWYKEEVNKGRTLYFEAPSMPHQGYLIYDLAKLTGRTTKLNRYERIDHVCDHLTPAHCLIIDNAQRLYNPRSGNRQDCFSLLQQIQDRTGCSIVLIFVKETIFLSSEKHRKTQDPLDEILHGPASGFFNQFIGRIGGEENIIHLPDNTSDNDLIAFTQVVGFSKKEATMLLPVVRFLDRQPGGLRVALEKLQKAAERAAAAKRKISLLDLLDHLPVDSLSSTQLDKLHSLKQRALEVPK